MTDRELAHLLASHLGQASRGGESLDSGGSAQSAIVAAGMYKNDRAK
jgi:hypothetical protein